ncbi:MAG: Translation initiation factor IF-3 [Microgenomates group bacterium GW2011_GWA2_40_6]|nr:MAG: Translation initiation factor IF-3 [Microgenomates group bacterium GW2011_GWA2_40_6]
MYPQRTFAPRYRINQYITAPEFRLIDEDAKQIGIMSRDEAIKLSHESGLDLIEIAPKAVPPVVKLIEFSKFKYQEAKKQKAEKRGIKGGETKEIQMTPFIGEGDFETRIKRAFQFLSTGNKVKISIKFQGRQIQKPEFGHQLLARFIKDLSVTIPVTPDGEAKLIGKRLLLTLSPNKSKNKNEKTKS